MPAARIFDFVEGDNADVVAVRQHLVHMRGLQGTFRAFPAGAVRQAAMVEFTGQAVHRPRTGREPLESPLHKSPPVLVKDHVRDVPPVAADTDVEIADRRETRGSAIRGFLPHLVGNIFPAGSGLILVDHGQHPVEKLTGRCLVNVLRCGHEKNTEVPQSQRERGVFVPVPRETAELIDDHDIDVAVPLNAVDHRPESLAAFQVLVRGHARLDILTDHVGIRCLGFRPARDPLRRNRDAFRIIVGADLGFRRHPKVENGT
nr:hypothetical protein [Frankia sp. AgB32]